MTLTLIGNLICTSDDELAIVVAHVADHIRLSRAEPGCLSFDIVQTQDPRIWQVSETFTDQAAFDAHQARTRASPWAQATQHIARRWA